MFAAALCAVGLSAFAAEPVAYLDWDDVEKKMTNATCTAYEVVTNGMTVFDAGKTYAVTNDVTVSSCITVNGTVANPTYLILCDGAKLTVECKDYAKAGVKVESGKALVICGQENGTGALEATGEEWGAGIGGDENGAGGTVTINGGVVTATGKDGGAGIGGGMQGDGGTVTINGGIVTAAGGGYGAAGIGGGNNGAGGIVTINGGTVTATGGPEGGAGIGGSYASDHGTVEFGEGVWIVKQGDAAPGEDTTVEAYVADHSAKYAHIEPGCALKIPVVTGYTYVVSNETAEIASDFAGGTNTYAVVTGATVKVSFTLAAGYVWQGDITNPKTIENIEVDTIINAEDLPKALAKMGVAVFPAEKLYDAESTNVTWVVTNAAGAVISDATIWLREKGTDDWILAAEFESYFDATNVMVQVRAEKSDFTTVTNEATVLVKPRSVTLTSGTETFTYDAQAHSNMTVTVSGVGFVPGQGVATNGFPSITDVGTVPNAFSYEFLDSTKAGNYAVSCVTGTLTVTKAKFNPAKGPDGVHPASGVDPEDPVKVADPTIPFSSFDTTNVYDGAAHTIDTNALVNAYKDLFLVNAPSFSYALASNGTYGATAPAFTDVTVTSVWYKVSAANFEDVIHPAKVIITNRCVTLTSKDAEWPYDGQAHSNMTVTAEGFIEGEGVTTNGFATITNVGSEPNAFSYEFLDGTKAENYSVSCVTGTLTIAGYFVEYNGSGADGALAEGTMETNTFGTGIETNLTRCAFTLENFVFSGWTTNGVDKAYDDGQRGKDFVQSGETLSLTALWTRVIVPVTVTNLANTTVSVTTNDTPVELFTTVDGCGIYNVQTNADVMIVYRADSGWAFDASGTNGTVVLSNVTWSVNDFVPEEALPKVVPITSVITEEDVEDGPDGTVIIKSCHPTADGVLIIPATIGGKVVKAIADKAFQYATWLKELVIEEGLGEIGNAAFDNCSGLALVTIPASVTNVGQVAFMRCFALKTLEFAGDAPAMQKLAKLGYGICWGAHGFDVKVDPDKSGWDETSLGVLCAGWQKFEDKEGGEWTCTYDPKKVVPRITGVERLAKTDASLTINNVKKGLTYTLEGAEKLDGEWKALKTVEGGDADTLVFAIPGDTGASAFFRVTVSDGSDK